MVNPPAHSVGILFAAMIACNIASAYDPTAMVPAVIALLCACAYTGIECSR